MKKNKVFIFLGFFVVIALSLAFKNISAQSEINSDAIAVRILPNPNHYSIYRWYESQGFRGSPQALSVDGYEAVRDGRTVYVNAANIDINNNKIYTNIYLISFNQDPSVKTVDILGQIVKYWKFNNNLIEDPANPPTCTISSLACLSDGDCSSEQFCASSTIASSSCQLKNSQNCLVDEDCPLNFFCDSKKGKIIRDLKRIGKVEELKESLYAYKLSKGFYPKLTAGTYLSGHTISVWPSWSENFLTEANMAQEFIDPINRLGSCPGFDLKTCWNENTKRFVNQPRADYLALPAGSYAFVYKTDLNGSNYNLCSVMETKDLFNFVPTSPSSSACITDTGVIFNGTSTNTAPIIINTYLNGEADQEFNGSVKVFDAEANPLTWTLDTTAVNWVASGWSAAPILKDTNIPNQKKLYSLKAGRPGNYDALLKVMDNQGGVLSTTTSIKIINTPPFIEAEDGEYSPSTSSPLTYSFYFSDNNLISSSSFALTKLSASPAYNLLTIPPASRTIESAGQNRYRVTYLNNIASGTPFYNDQTYFYRLTIGDGYFATTTKDFKIKLKIEAPALNFNCALNNRVGKPYSCFLGYTFQNNHNLTYTATGTLLSIISASGTAILKGTTTPIGEYPITIKARNEYHASSSKSFTLRVNNYCGDGFKQTPNGEGRGGIYNDGYEDCDNTSGTTTNVASSSIYLQYACSTVNSIPTPYPILNNNYCVFKSPVNGGGYCGDGYCYVSLENNTNCPADCDPSCVSNCTGKTCGSDGCGGICGTGTCPSGQTCNNGTCVGSPDYYMCAGNSYLKAGNNYPCPKYGQFCYEANGSCNSVTHGDCGSLSGQKLYNCDGVYDCESTTCACGYKASWNNGLGECICNDPSEKACGYNKKDCYNDTSYNCCSFGETASPDHLVCPENTACCATSTNPNSTITNFCGFAQGSLTPGCWDQYHY